MWVCVLYSRGYQQNQQHFVFKDMIKDDQKFTTDFLFFSVIFVSSPTNTNRTLYSQEVLMLNIHSILCVRFRLSMLTHDE